VRAESAAFERMSTLLRSCEGRGDCSGGALVMCCGAWVRSCYPVSPMCCVDGSTGGGEPSPTVTAAS